MRVRRHRRPPFVLLLGAGASVHSGCPDGRTFVRRFLEASRGQDATAGLSEHELRRAFDDEWSAAGEDNRIVLTEDIIGVPNPSRGYLALAVLLREGYFGHMLTTNVDSLIEEALGLAAFLPRDYRVLVVDHDSPERVVQEMQAPTPRIKLLKLHGDVAAGVISFTDDEVAQLPVPVEEQVSALSRQDIVIVGHSLNDPDLRRCFDKVTEGGSASIWYVNPAGPSNYVEGLLAARRSMSNIVTGPNGAFERFFHLLYTEVLSADFGAQDEFRRQIIEPQLARYRPYLE